jgi:hypothetical protein
MIGVKSPDLFARRAHRGLSQRITEMSSAVDPEYGRECDTIARSIAHPTPEAGARP